MIGGLAQCAIGIHNNRWTPDQIRNECVVSARFVLQIAACYYPAQYAQIVDHRKALMCRAGCCGIDPFANASEPVTAFQGHDFTGANVGYMQLIEKVGHIFARHAYATTRDA